MSFIRTGVFATDEEVEALKAAASAPAIALHIPRRSVQQICHDYALAHGLPEIRGYYGCDLTNGEFVTVEGER